MKGETETCSSRCQGSAGVGTRSSLQPWRESSAPGPRVWAAPHLAPRSPDLDNRTCAQEGWSVPGHLPPLWDPWSPQLCVLERGPSQEHPSQGAVAAPCTSSTPLTAGSGDGQHEWDLGAEMPSRLGDTGGHELRRRRAEEQEEWSPRDEGRGRAAPGCTPPTPGPASQ